MQDLPITPPTRRRIRPANARLLTGLHPNSYRK